MARVQKRTIAAHLGVSPGRVSQYIKLGMPVTDLASAERWRDRNIAHRPTPAATPARAPASGVPADALGERVADLLAAAGEDIVALLVAEALVADVDAGSVAASAVAVALSDALDRSGGDGEPLLLVAGPLSYGPPEAEIAARRRRIEARVAAIRAELDGDQPTKETA